MSCWRGGALPGQMQGMPGMPGAVFNGVPGAMRVPPMPMGQPGQLPPVQVPQGVPQGVSQMPMAGQQDVAPGTLPYQPENNGLPLPVEPAPPATGGKFR